MARKKHKFLVIIMMICLLATSFSNFKFVNASSYTYVNDYPITSYTEDVNTLKDLTSLQDGEMDVKKSVVYNSDGNFNINLMSRGKKYISNLTDESEYNIVFILDNSGSMYNTPSRIQGSTDSINEIIRELSEYPKINIGVVSYSSIVSYTEPLGQKPAAELLKLGHYTSTSDTDTFIEYVDDYDPATEVNAGLEYYTERYLQTTTEQNGNSLSNKFYAGGTFTQAGIIAGYEMLHNATNKDTAKPVLILMSDGEATGYAYPNGGDEYSDYDWEIKSINDLLTNYTTAIYGGESFTTNSIMPYATIRSAIYLSGLIEQEYDREFEFYTFGYDIDPAYYYAQSTLNPTKENIDNLETYMLPGREQYGLYELVYNSGLTWDELMYTDGYYSNADGTDAAEIYKQILFEDSRAENAAIKTGTNLIITDTIDSNMTLKDSNIKVTLNGQESSVALATTDNNLYSYKDAIVSVEYNKTTNVVKVEIQGDYFASKDANISFDVKLKDTAVGEIGGKIYYTNSSAQYTYQTSAYNPVYKGATITNNLEASGSITLTKIPATVIVKYVDESGNEIASSVTKNGYLHDEYTTEAKTIDGYMLDSEPYNVTGTMATETTTVIYKYKQLLKTEPNVAIGKTAEWVDIENGIAKITLTENETVEEKVDTSDYVIVYDVSGSMPIVTVNGYEPGTYNISVDEIYNIGCKNPNHYSKLKPGASNDINGWRNAYHYSNNGTPNNTADDILLNYTASTFQKQNWKGDVIQTFYLSSSKDFMYSRANGCYSTLETSQRMINEFVDEALKYDANTKFAYVAFGGSVVKSNGFTTGANLKNLVNRSTQYGGTAYAEPLQKADQLLDSYTGSKKVKVIFITDGDNYDESASTVLSAAQTLKNNHGVELYSVSVDYNAPAGDDVRQMADKYVYLSSSNVDNVVNTFINYSLNRTSIKATNKVYTDKINSEYFEIVNSGNYTLPANVTATNNQITWNIPNNTTNEDKEYTTSFYVKLKDEYRKTADDTKYKTNLDTDTQNGAVLTYTISGGYYDSQTRTLSKESPELPYGLDTITATKAWDDYENKFSTRPDSIQITLNKNSTAVDSATISNDSYEFPGYKTENGSLVVYGLIYDNNSRKVTNEYTVTETKVDNYDITQTGNADNLYTVKNTLNMDSQIEIKYVDTEGQELAATEVRPGKVGEEYTTSRKEIQNYRKHGDDPQNAQGVFTPDKITITYVYEKIPAKIIVNYIDNSTLEVLDSEVKDGFVSETVTTSEKDIEGYVICKYPEAETYIYTEEEQVVNYYYLKESDVVTKYIDENTNQELVTAITETYKEGDTYTTDKKSFDGYTFTKSAGSTTGTIAREDIEVIYYYKKTSAGIEVKYIDQVTGEEIADSVTKTGLEKDPYTTEAKDIGGYVLVVTPDNASGEMTVDKITIVYEYRKLSDVTTRYIDENTNQEIVFAVTEKYKEEDSYTTEKKSFDGYTFTKDSGNTSGIVERENIEVIYYYKKTSAGIEVKYIDQVTKEEIADSVTKTGLEKDPYTTEAKDIDDYVLVFTPDNANGEMAVDKITIVYEYRLLSDVTTKYIDENTNQEIVTAITETYKEGDTYTTEKKSFEGYTFTKDTKNTSGVVERENIEVIYYYKKISAGVEVKYIDQVTKAEIATPNEYSGLEKDPYTTTPKEVVGYELVLIPDNASGEMTVDKITVVYEYRLLSNVTTKYIDENTNIEIVEAVVDTYKEGDTYTTEKKSFDGYTFTKDSGNLSGIVERENIEVIYYYKKLAAGIEVKFIDQVTGEEIATSVTKTGLENDPYTTEPKEVDGYELVVIPKNSTGKMKVEKTTIIYEYRKLSDVVTRYIDENTGLEIVDSVQNTYKEGDTYTTEKKSFDGYTFTKDTNNTKGTVQREDIEVIYYYKKTSAGIEAIYIDQVTGEEIAESVVKTGLENDAYTTEAKKIDGYELVVTPLNANGKMTVDKITIKYKYRKLANVTTKHIDANTGKEIVADVVNTYKEGDEYQVLPQSLPGYTLVEEPEEKTGIMGREDITKVFKYKKISSGLVVKYVDEISNELLDEKTYTGNEKDIINLEELAFENYMLTKRPADSTVELTVEPQERYFYYKKIVNLDVVGIDKETGEELYSKVQSGVEGTEYTTEPITIPGYDILEEPENKNGIYKKDSDKVIYVYSKIAGNVIVRYVDKDTNENLDGYEIKGHVGDEYKTEKKSFEDYNFVEVVGAPNGKLEEDSKEIVYYYEKKTGKVIVTYVDTEGNVLLTEEQVGKVKEEYNIVEKEFDNYIVIERPESTSGEYIDGTIELKFVLEKLKGKIKVNFVDRDGNKLFESIITEGEIDEEYYLEALEKEGYIIAENAKIEVKYINGEIVIDVIYEKIEEPPATGDINVVM